MNLSELRKAKDDARRDRDEVAWDIAFRVSYGHDVSEGIKESFRRLSNRYVDLSEQYTQALAATLHDVFA